MKNENLKIKLKNLTKESGVYKMLDKSGKVIYVGKAKNLKNRVSNYFVKSNQDEKTQLLQKNIDNFSIIITKTETQALLLENDLIKQFKPKYNILLKDSKSYPYIYISNDKHPRLGMFRGKKNKETNSTSWSYLSSDIFPTHGALHNPIWYSRQGRDLAL